MTDFTDNVALITGAASGIGKAIAGKCLELNMSVVLADIHDKNLDHCAKELKKIKNGRILSVLTDVSKEEDMINLAQKTLSEFGKINFLFNNAGIAGPLGPLWTQATTHIEKVLGVNLFGTIHGIKTFVPIMLKQNDQCYIINTCAGAGFLTGKGLSAYKASKHAIAAISETLAADLAQMNAKIQVSLLIPHWVDTQIPNSIEEADASCIQNQLEHLKKFGIPPNMAAEKLFDGIMAKQFYIFTHPEEHLPKIKQRMEKILETDILS